VHYCITGGVQYCITEETGSSDKDLTSVWEDLSSNAARNTAYSEEYFSGFFSVIQSRIFIIFTSPFINQPKQWPRGVRRSSAAARLLGLGVRIPPGKWMSVSCEYCVV
jgi:hypothetical protein